MHTRAYTFTYIYTHTHIRIILFSVRNVSRYLTVFVHCDAVYDQNFTGLEETWWILWPVLSQVLMRELGELNGSCVSYYWSLLYSAILRSRTDSLRSHVILHEWIAFYSAFLNIHRSGVLIALAWLVPHETAAISARSVYTIQPCTMWLHAKPHT